MALDYVVMDVPTSFADYRLKNGIIIRLLSGQTFFLHFVWYWIAFFACNRPEAASDVVSGRFVRPVVLDKCVKFRDPSLNRGRKIPPKTVAGSIFDSFLALTSDQT